MKIQLKEITIRKIVKNYIDNQDEGIKGYNSLLDIRPAYQREFVYKDKQRDAVIDTVRKGFPLNVIYWVKNSDGTFELLDGQQRTISICDYVIGKFSVNFQKFHNLETDEQAQILDYKMMVYFCEGEDKEKLDWFKTINIAGLELKPQELKNAIYTGPWLSDAKKYFSKPGCPAHGIAQKYLKGASNRQDYLETAIKWVSYNTVKEYMSEHQQDIDARELWNYFETVINWVKEIFPNPIGSEMKGINYGYLYNFHKYDDLDSEKIAKEIEQLLLDPDVTSVSGIYNYVITRDEKYLNIRSFNKAQKLAKYNEQKGFCPKCNPNTPSYELTAMEADHIDPWHSGGKTELSNCQMLCKHHNRVKSNN